MFYFDIQQYSAIILYGMKPDLVNGLLSWQAIIASSKISKLLLPSNVFKNWSKPDLKYDYLISNEF